MGVNGFDLLNLALKRNSRVVILTAHALNPECLRRSYEKGARAYLPKEKLGEIVSFLEDIFEESDSLSGWRHTLERLEGYFNSKWGENWQQKAGHFWKDFYQKK
jgi:DNA-binding NarL/FixJ family response regulator